MSEDPWKGLARPDAEGQLTARRINESIRWDLFWAKDAADHCLLVFAHDPSSSPREKPPSPKGIKVEIVPAHEKGKAALTIRLVDRSARDVFLRLCLDIVDSAATAATEAASVQQALTRTWRWHHLLRGGGNGILSAAEQLGLLAELAVLEKYFLNHMAVAQALSCWKGPEDSPQDFVCGRVAIESKARGRANEGDFRISSEYQLSTIGFDALFLHLMVYDVAAPGEGDDLNQVVNRIHGRVATGGAACTARFSSLLTSAGFREGDDYSSSRWQGDERAIYRVVDDFPRVVHEALPPGIAKVQYSIAANSCGRFLTSPDKVLDELRSF